MLKTIVTERVGGSSRAWRAYFKEDSERYGDSMLPTYGTGNRESEAVAALLHQKIGELLLQNPAAFGVVIERRES